MKNYILLGILTLSLSCQKDNNTSSNNNQNNNNNLSSENNGKLIKILVSQDKNFNFFYTQEFEYDQNGKLVGFSHANGTEITKWTRNQNGYIIKAVFTAPQSNYTSVTNYYMRPDNTNQYLYYIKTNSYNSTRDSGVFIYSNNKLVSMGGKNIFYDSKGNIIKQGDEEYTWDNKPAAISLANEDLPSGRFHGFSNVLNEKIYSTTNFNYSYTYNSHGRPASAIVTRTFQSSPTVVEYFKYLYD